MLRCGMDDTRINGRTAETDESKTCHSCHGPQGQQHHGNTGYNAEYACNKHKPPVLYDTGGLLSKFFKSTFHDTDNLISIVKGNYCAKVMLSITNGFPPRDQKPAIYICSGLILLPFLSFIEWRSTTTVRELPKSYIAGSLQ